MRTAFTIMGWLLFAVGLIMILIGVFYDITIESPGRYDAYAGYVPSTRSVNFHLMFQALAVLVAGGFSMLCGAIFIAAGSLARSETAPALPGSATPEPPPTAAAPSEPARDPGPSASAMAAPADYPPMDKMMALWIGVGVAAILGALLLYATWHEQNDPDSSPTPPPAVTTPQ